LSLAGDGIREGVQSLTELVNRNATKAFTFGVIECAIYRFAKNQFALQPRVLAETEMLMRTLTVVNITGDTRTIAVEEVDDDNTQATGGREHLKHGGNQFSR
jgi:hypothetical protein